MMVSSQILILVNMHDYLQFPNEIIMMFITLKTMVTRMMAIYQITMVTVRMVFISIRIIIMTM
jgi:hypothetical protein